MPSYKELKFDFMKYITITDFDWPHKKWEQEEIKDITDKIGHLNKKE